jgi:hypothetical protein
MDIEAKKTAVATVVCACVGVASTLATDGRSHGTPRVNVSSFPSETLEMALAACPPHQVVQPPSSLRQGLVFSYLQAAVPCLAS